MYKEKTLPYSYPRGMIHVLKFDSQIDEPDNYSYFCDVLLAANEDDIVEIYFSTRGGNGESMITLMNLMQNCKAEIHGYLMSSAHSAGSYLFLSCDVCHVGKHVSMLCHVVSYGTGGSHHEVKAMVEHIDKEERSLVNETYKHFLSDKEIEELLNGKQIWLYEDEIITRLENRQKAFEEEHAAAKEAQYNDLMATFDEHEVPEAILKKLTKSQLIDYLMDKVIIDIQEDGKFEVIPIEGIEENLDN